MNPENSREEGRISRRDFLGVVATGAFITAMVMPLIGLFKFMKPQLFPDVSRAFKIGRPGEIPVGFTKIYPEQKVIVTRDSQGIAAMSLICTHLGCIVTKTERGFSCPCHGSTFSDQGVVRKGPAPKPLPWFDISFHPSGKLVVNADKEVPAGTRLSV